GAAKVLGPLAAWVEAQPAADSEHHLLEALWLYQALDVVEPNLLKKLAQARDHHVRAAAMRIFGQWHDRAGNVQELLALGVADDHPQVRLEAVRALASMGTRQAAALALRAL